MKPYTREGETLMFFLILTAWKTVKRFIDFYLFYQNNYSVAILMKTTLLGVSSYNDYCPGLRLV